MPNKLVYNDKHLNVTWSPICGKTDAVERILVSVKDTTEEEKLRSQSLEQNKIMQAVEKIIAVNPDTFNGFISSGIDFIEQNIELLNSNHKFQDYYLTLLHNIHTVKGNARTLDFIEIAVSCHELESLIHEAQGKEEIQKILDEHLLIEDSLEYFDYVNSEKLGRKSNLNFSSVESQAILNLVSRASNER